MQGTRFELDFTGEKSGISPVVINLKNNTKDTYGFTLKYLLVKSFDHDDGFITIESWRGLCVLNIDTIIAIKPKKQEKK